VLLHIIPRLYASSEDEPKCALLDFHCPELDLRLRDGIELVARRPYPNKNFLVACRKMGHKAMEGLLIETKGRIHSFSTVTRWAVGDERIAHHRVQYSILDGELDAITDSMVLWSAMATGLGGFSNRRPATAKDWTPAQAQPRMELVSRERGGCYSDTLDSAGRIVERAETWRVPTVERERVLYGGEASFFARIPPANMAFKASI